MTAVSPCGTISDSVPEFTGADLPQGYQWMAMSDRSTRTGKWGKWNRVQEWQGVQSYETFLYSSSGGTGDSSSSNTAPASGSA